MSNHALGLGRIKKPTFLACSISLLSQWETYSWAGFESFVLFLEDTETDVFHLLDHCSHVCNSWKWVRVQLGASAGSLMGVAGMQTSGSSSAAFPGLLSGSWNWSGTAEMCTSSCKACWQHSWQLYLLGQNTMKHFVAAFVFNIL